MTSLLLFMSAVTEHAAPSHAGEEHAAAGQDPALVIIHHASDHSIWGFPSRHLVFFALAVLLIIVLVRVVLRGYRRGIPHGLAAFVEMLVLFVRDEIAEKNIGRDSRKFTPLLCSFFFFILVAAFLGLMPFAATSTGNIAVTMALATVSFLAQQYAGISKFGLVGHFKNLIPSGIPFWMLPVMVPIEILGLFTKPFALMIRLFANMLAGHIVITTLLILIPMMARISTLFGVAIVPVSLGLSLFIMMLEILVAFIQAFIFTLLSAIFIGMFAHPAH